MQETVVSETNKPPARRWQHVCWRASVKTQPAGSYIAMLNLLKLSGKINEGLLSTLACKKKISNSCLVFWLHMWTVWKKPFYIQFFNRTENFVWVGKLTQLSLELFNSVVNEESCVFAVITRLFQTAERFTEEVINLEIWLILEQAEPCMSQRCFGVEQRNLSSGLYRLILQTLLTGLRENHLAQHNMCMVKCTDVGHFTTTWSPYCKKNNKCWEIKLSWNGSKKQTTGRFPARINSLCYRGNLENPSQPHLSGLCSCLGNIIPGKLFQEAKV